MFVFGHEFQIYIHFVRERQYFFQKLVFNYYWPKGNGQR